MSQDVIEQIIFVKIDPTHIGIVSCQHLILVAKFHNPFHGLPMYFPHQRFSATPVQFGYTLFFHCLCELLYHLLVMLKSRDVALADVMAELDRRQSQSGLAEKAARKT